MIVVYLELAFVGSGRQSHCAAAFSILIVKTPTDIMDIITRFSGFQKVYKDAILFLEDKGEMLNMVFQTITELDENSLKRMVTNRDAVIEQTKAELEQKRAEIEKKDSELEKKEDEIRSLKERLKAQGISLNEE